MKFNIIGKNYKASNDLEERIAKKLSVLERYHIISPDDTCQVLLRHYADKEKIEVTIYTKHAILRSEATDTDMRNCLDKVVEKLQDQIRRVRTRIHTRKSNHPLYETLVDLNFGDEDEEIDDIVRTKTIIPEKMSLEEAIINMDLLDHSFYIYTDDETNQIAVVYRRYDGGYGLIETES